jgi:hypothetical protein
MAQQDDNLNEDQKEMLQNIDDLDLDAFTNRR